MIGVKTGLLIDNQWVVGASPHKLKAVDPATEETIAEVEVATAEDVDRAVRSSDAAMRGSWRRTSPEQRGALLDRLGDLIAEHAGEIAALETRDMGKPLRESHANVARSVRTCRYYAGAVDKLLGDTIPVGYGGLDFSLIEPLGVTAHITPWNYPFANACRSLPTALAAGSTVILKPASETVLTTLLLGELCVRAGFPPGVVNVVVGPGRLTGAALAAHRLVRGITFTGSVSTGQAIARAASDPVRPTVLELGGKNPQIVFADCDFDNAIAQTMRGAFTNGGQVCTSISRVLVERRIHDRYVEALRSRVGALTIGRGVDNRDLGPLVSATHRGEVESYVEIARADGARLVAGGERPPEFERGYFYRPTLFDKVSPDMRIAREEVFGPLLVVIPFDDDEEALEIANSLSLGLAAGVFTRDLKRALRFVRDIQSGMVWVNEWFMNPVQAPHGGVKESGLGREQGMMALMNYSQVKNVAFRI